MDVFINKFLAAFDGYKRAFGQHGHFKKKDNGKMEGQANTVISPLTNELVEKHLNGAENGLGIIPLREDDTCCFGAIDLDIVGINPLTHTIQEMEEKVTKLGLPLVPCSTKSGGVHLYCFTQQPIPAALMVKRLKEWAALLGYGNHEIFPKQIYRVNDQDIGNWINLPYYNYKEPNRFAVNKGKQINLEEFFELVEVMRISEDEMNNFQLVEMDESYDDAPPCIQILSTMGIDEGSRNNGLYNLAIYYKKKDEATWQQRVEEANQTIVTPMLSTKEMETVVKSVNKKDFFYKCKEYPICQHCNKAECRKRKYGIGSGSDEATFENITKYIAGEEISWFVEYQGKRIQLTTEELLNQTKMQTKLVDALNKTFTPISNKMWLIKVNMLLSNCTIVNEPIQASRKGQFYELLDSFLTTGVSGDEKDDLLRFNTVRQESTGETLFRSFNLFTYLKNKRFKHTEKEVWMWMKENGATSKKMKIAKKSLNVWCIPTPETFSLETPNEDKI